MEVTTLLLATAVLFVLFFLLFPQDTKTKRIRRLVNKLPGPPSYPLVGNILPVLMAPRNERWQVLMQFNAQYQPLFRWWLGTTPFVTITRPEDIEVILGSTQNLDKSLYYKFLHPWLGTGLLTSSGSKWHTHRKMITPTFHFKILDNFVEVFSEKSEILVDKLEKEVGSPGFDVYPYISKCALDIICETAMGTSVKAQDGDNASYVSTVVKMSTAIVERIPQPWLHPDFLFKLSSTGKVHDKCLKELHGFTNKVIKERKQEWTKREQQEEDTCVGKKRRVVFLDMLLEASEAGSKLTDEEIREEVDTFMFEGHDTTTSAMSWALYLLGLHPDVQELAYREQEEIFQGSDRSCTMKDLNDMKYLERVIKESLRLYPSVPGISRYAKTDIQLGEHLVPAGVTIDINIMVVHLNPDHFPDPKKFDPDRFLPERVAKRHPYAYIPFSAGPRNCIGQKFALLEEKTVLSYVLRRYRVTSLDDRDDIKLIPELITRAEHGIRICISSRKSSALVC